MRLYLLGLLLLAFTTSPTIAAFKNVVSRGQITCDADHCNPNWAPFENMQYALRGYSIRKGNPVDESGDPGFLSQIFVPTVLNEKTSTYSLADGITAVDLNYCKRTMSSKAFTNIKSYRDYLTSKSSSGVNLQIGVEREVTVGIDVKGVSASSSATIPPPFTRAWGDSNGMSKLKTFFSQKKGMMTMAMGMCLSYEVQLDTHHLPPFTTPFKAAIQQLISASSSWYWFRRGEYFKFIRQYGTHFTIKTKLGAQFVHETKYSGNVRRQFNFDTLRACSHVQGSKIFGIQIEKDSSKCSSSDKRRLDAMSRDNVEEIIITKGSRPTDIKNWVTQSFTPVPLQFQLSPIVNLFTKTNLQRNKISATDAEILKFKKWFLPMYWDYCKMVGVPCQPPTGCGYDDVCPIDTICTGSGSKHECTAWSSWKCATNCGNGKYQKRTRSCTGCSGQTVQTKRSDCKPQNPCYLKYAETSRSTNWNRDGNGKSHFLDRHWLKCPPGKAIRGFKLQREGSTYRYNHICGTIQYPCTESTTVNKKTHNDDGNMVYLDRQTVRCGWNSVITQFGLRRDGDDSWYRYHCCKLTYGHQQCRKHYTGFDSDGGGNSIFLDRQNVMCPKGTTMRSFKLDRNSQHTEIRYIYTCCKTVR